MKSTVDCLPCLVRQAVEAARLSNPDPAGHELLVRELLLAATSLDFSQPPPALAQRLQRQLRESSGCLDPYAGAKQRFNRLALELLPPLAKQVCASADPFGMAVRLSIAGNIIDLGAKSGLGETDVRSAVGNALSQPLAGDVEALRVAVSRAKSILFLADNAGEIVFDSVLIGLLPRGRVTVAVRGRPTINDATREDAAVAGIGQLAEIIDNGSDAPGTLLRDCSEEFRARFLAADLIIAKGQGNFESLHGVAAPLFCLFRVKCAPVSSHCGLPIGAHVVWRSSH